MSFTTGSIKEIILNQENNPDKSLLSFLINNTKILTSKQGWENDIDAILADLGHTSKVSRVWIFQIIGLDSEYITQDYTFEWAADPKYVQLGMPAFEQFTNKINTEEYSELIESRKRGEWQKIIPRNLKDSLLKTDVLGQNIKSMLTIPIIVEESLWGILGYDDCEREYDWSETEIALFGIASIFISSIILKNRLNSKEKQLNILQKIISNGSFEYDIRDKHLLIYHVLFSPSDSNITDKHFSLFEFLEFVHKDDKKNLLKATNEFFKDNLEVFSYDLRIKNREDNYQWVEIRGTLERDMDNNPLKLSGIII
ncbi:MAG: hypothetical protein DRP58_07490 [Spirochaetes bacterium]|nr:MAG: hypothetical protein DRP58_07490 [Spirochaetota bacterium]